MLASGWLVDTPASFSECWLRWAQRESNLSVCDVSTGLKSCDWLLLTSGHSPLTGLHCQLKLPAYLSHVEAQRSRKWQRSLSDGVWRWGLSVSQRPDFTALLHLITASTWTLTCGVELRTRPALALRLKSSWLRARASGENQTLTGGQYSVSAHHSDYFCFSALVTVTSA